MSDVITAEQLKSHGVALVPEIEWDIDDPLRPGLDYRDGIVYFTIPAMINREVTKGKGKGATTEIVKEPGLACLTSEREQFPYTKEAVEARGFGYPENVVRGERRWSTTGIRAFLSGSDTPPQPAALHAAIRKVYETYIEFADEAYYDILPLFIMGSYVFRLYRALGYIHFNGTAASGKSQNLRILDALGFNNQWASNISAAGLYRSLAGNPGLVCIDEAEGWEGERGEELRRILNAGYLDGSTVKRAEKGANDRFQIASFESYGPKAIASINPLDAVIGSRCLVVAMRPAIRRIPEFDKDDHRWQQLRDQLYLFTMYHAEAISGLIEDWNTSLRHTRAPDLVGRQWQITQLYVTLADYLDMGTDAGLCDRLIAFFNKYFADLQKQQDATDRIRIVLKSLPRVLARFAPHDGGYYYLKTIHEVVHEYLEEDQKDYYKTRNLGKHLDVLGFKKKRSAKQGTQVWLDPAVVRGEFVQRRVEPHDEDRAWLAGEIEYTHYNTVVTPTKPSEERASIWAEVAEEE